MNLKSLLYIGFFLISLLGIGVLNSCSSEVNAPFVNDSLNDFPEIIYPEGNEYSKARWELGKRLFNDPILSRDSSISCASCHKSNLAFVDNLPTTPGVEGRSGFRNAPTLANVAFSPYFMVEGGVPNLELQVLAPILDHVEFDHDILQITQKLQSDSVYVNLAKNAYAKTIDPFVITRAIANFERTMISDSSPYDLYIKGDLGALTEKEKNGMALFNSSKTNCSECHSGILLTDFSFKNTGLFEVYSDSGRMRLTMKEQDRAKFKVPTLRNVEVTGPYMHNGSFSSLEEVVEHYNSGGKSHLNKSKLVKELNLTDKEKEELIAFLKSLTDTIFINDPKWK